MRQHCTLEEMQQHSTSAVVAGGALATLAASSRNTTKKGIVWRKGATQHLDGRWRSCLQRKHKKRIVRWVCLKNWLPQKSHPPVEPGRPEKLPRVTLFFGHMGHPLFETPPDSVRRNAATQHLGCKWRWCTRRCLRHTTDIWKLKKMANWNTNRFALILHTLNSKQHSALADDGGCDDGGDVAASSRNSWIPNNWQKQVWS